MVIDEFTNDFFKSRLEDTEVEDILRHFEKGVQVYKSSALEIKKDIISYCKHGDKEIILPPVKLFNIYKEYAERMKTTDDFQTFLLKTFSTIPITVNGYSITLIGIGGDYINGREEVSCPLLANGKCTCLSEKPAECAIYPLNRVIDKHNGDEVLFVNKDIADTVAKNAPKSILVSDIYTKKVKSDLKDISDFMDMVSKIVEHDTFKKLSAYGDNQESPDFKCSMETMLILNLYSVVNDEYNYVDMYKKSISLMEMLIGSLRI